MDTSTSTDMHYKVADLVLEDRDLYERSIQTIQAIIAELKPIVKYITKPCKVRINCVDGGTEHLTGIAARESGDEVLLMTRAGTFVIGQQCSYDSDNDGSWELHEGTRPDVWTEFYFDHVVEGLRRRLKEARDQEAMRLETTSRRLAKLDEIMKIIKR